MATPTANRQKPALKRTVYTGTFIYTPKPTTLSITHSTAVGVGEAGEIAFIEHDLPTTDPSAIHAAATKHGWAPETYTIFTPPTAAGNGTDTSVELTTFFFPGLVDTHTHAPQYPNTGIFGSSTLLSWLQTYTFPLEGAFSSLALAHRIYPRVVARSLAHGTTTAAYYATTHVPATNFLADVCLARGQRALVGRVCMDRMSPEDYRDESAEVAVRKTEEVMAHCREIDPEEMLVRPVITPRFAPSCTDGCLAALGALHKSSGAFVQTHVSENHAEVELVKELFPAASSYVGVYKDSGLLSAKTVLAHAVHLSREELKLVKDAEAGIAHCPVSNSSLTSGCARVRDMLDRGVKVGLGTDMSGGYSASILEVARQALLVSRYVSLEVTKERGAQVGERYKLSVEEALYLATRGGAEVVGLGGRVGAFEVGMEFDAQLVCLAHVPGEEKPGEASSDEVAETAELADYSLPDEYGPVDLFGWEPWPDVVAKWVYTADDRNVGAVWVKGRLVHSRDVFGIGA